MPHSRAFRFALAIHLAGFVSILRGAAPFAMDNGVGRGTWSPEQQAATLAELGYSGISYNYTRASDLPLWQAALAKHQLNLVALYFPLRLDGEPLPADFSAALSHLRGTDTVLWTIIPQPTAKNISASELESAALTRLRDLADRAAAHQLRVVLYPHKGFYLATAEHAFALTQKLRRPNVTLTFNLCHELAAGHGPRLQEILRHVAPALSLVTLNGASDLPGSGWENYIQLLGRGTYDLAPLFRTLESLHYRGPIGIQFYNIKGDTRTNLETTLTAWRTLTARSLSSR